MRSWFIMANKTVLEYVMFLVNLMPRHQRPETIKIVSRVSEQMSMGGKKKKKKTFTVRHDAETNQLELVNQRKGGLSVTDDEHKILFSEGSSHVCRVLVVLLVLLAQWDPPE